MIAPVSARDRGLLLGGDGPDHGEPEQLRPLAHDQPDAARGGVQQDRVTGLERMDAPEQIGCGEAAHRHGRRGLVIDALRQLDEGRRRDQPLGAVGPERVDEAGVGDSIPDRHLAHPRADRLDHAGRLDAHARGKRDRIGAVPEVGVGEVEPHRDVAQPDLSRPGLSHLDVLEPQDFGPARLMKSNCSRHLDLLGQPRELVFLAARLTMREKRRRYSASVSPPKRGSAFSEKAA